MREERKVYIYSVYYTKLLICLFWFALFVPTDSSYHLVSLPYSITVWLPPPPPPLCYYCKIHVSFLKYWYKLKNIIYITVNLLHNYLYIIYIVLHNCFSNELRKGEKHTIIVSYNYINCLYWCSLFFMQIQMKVWGYLLSVWRTSAWIY